MIKSIHPIAGVITFLTVATFWISSLSVELLGTEAQVVAVKAAISRGIFLLVPAMAAVGVSGVMRARGRRGGLLGAKARRMRLIAANGFLVLIPSALYLASKARAAELDTAFHTVQAIELVAGAVNLLLLGMSMRDGMRLGGRLKRRAARI